MSYGVLQAEIQARWTGTAGNKASRTGSGPLRKATKIGITIKKSYQDRTMTGIKKTWSCPSLIGSYASIRFPAHILHKRDDSQIKDRD